MDPISLLVMALAKNPDLAASAVESAVKPGAVDVAKMQTSLADISRGILSCYHKTAKFRQTDILTTPWDRAWQYNAERSAVLQITFQGITSTQYQMVVAVMAKEMPFVARSSAKTRSCRTVRSANSRSGRRRSSVGRLTSHDRPGRDRCFVD